MAHNTRIRADLTAWQAFVPVDASEFNALDAYTFAAINGDAGGSWDPAAAISIGGSGIELRGASNTIASAANLVVQSGGDIELEDGGDINVQSGGYIKVLAGGIINLYNTAEQNIANGALLNVVSGGNIVVKTGGDIEVESGGDINVQDGGLINVLLGGAFNLKGSSSLNVEAAGHIDVEGGAEIRVENGGNIEVQDGGSINLLAGSVLWVYDQVGIVGLAGYTGGYTSWAGPDCFSFGATATGVIQGILSRSAAGRIPERVIAGNAGSATYSPDSADTVIVPAGAGTGASTYTLDGSTAVHGDKIRFICFDQDRTITFASAETIFSTAQVGATVLLRDATTTGYVQQATFTWSDGAAGHPATGWYLTDCVRSTA